MNINYEELVEAYWCILSKYNTEEEAEEKAYKELDEVTEQAHKAGLSFEQQFKAYQEALQG